MEISQLRYFSVVAKTGSMRKAAEFLHVTPAALSKSIGLLERELEEKLILPSGRGIVVSDSGTKLVARIEPILSALDRLKDDGKEEKGGPSQLRIATFEVFSTWLLGPVIEKQFSGIPILVHEMLPGQMETAIAENYADIGVTYLPIPSPSVEHLKVATVEMGVYGLASRFTKMAFEELPFAIPIAPIAGSPNKVKGLDGWPDDKVSRKVVCRVTLMESAMELCRKGLAVAYLPAPVVKRHNESVREKFALSPLLFPRLPRLQTRQDVYMIKRKSDVESSEFKRFAAALRSLCRSA